MLRWIGGKSKLQKQLLPYFPREITRYFEPFLGGGWVYSAFTTNRPYSVRSYANDLDPSVYNFYNCVINYPDILLSTIRYYHTMKLDKLVNLCDKNEGSEITRAALFYVRSCITYCGIQNNAKYMKDKSRFTASKINTLSDTMRYFTSLKMYNLDYADFLGLFHLTKSDFVYLDPPYHDCTMDLYVNHNEFDFVRFANYVKKLPCKFAVSIGDTPMARELFADYFFVKMSTYYGSSKKKVDELLILNYTVSNQLVLLP